MDYKKAFYSKLEDCYLGAKIKQANKDKSVNKSGFTNLLDIKEKYFNYVKNYLEQRIDFQNSEDASEIYNKLFTFFDSYLNETGTPFFIDTPIYKNIYAKIYSNSKDTNLFYKTQNLYYVKSDTLYESLTLQDSKEKYNFYFDASEFKQNSDNNKSKTFFKLHSIGFDENDIKQITIKVSNQKDLFPKLSNIFKQNSNEFNEEFLKALDNNKIKINEEELKKIFRSYRKQNEIDFFIHKNAKAFLEEQFDLWMFNHLYKDSQIQQWNPNAIKRMQEVRNIAYEIIYFIAKFEDELKAIWLKPKFAKNTEYVFSLDIIINKAKDSKKLLDLIFKDKNFKNQIKEWKELNLIDENFNISSLQSKIEEIEKYKFIPIDTKHLSREVKFELLSSFENLEELLNGELIKSDNFQALNTIMPKYQGKIDLIYIDPPYNSPSSEIIYKNNFKDSTWLSMMQNRLAIAKDFLSKSGILACAIDENEQENLGLLLSDIFSEYEKTCVSVCHNPKGIQGGFIAQNNEFAYFLSPEKMVSNNRPIPKDAWKYDHLRNWGGESERNTAKNCFYPIYVKDSEIIGFGNVCADDFHPSANIVRDDGIIEVYPIDSNGIERKWTYARQSVESIWKNLKTEKDKNGTISIKKPIVEVRFKTIWNDSTYIAGDYGSKILTNILPNNQFDFPKSIHTVKDSIYLASKEDSIILDFFGGSGTTAHAVLELNKEGSNRKFVLVEMGEHFYSVIIPRIKKVAFSSEWKEGKLKENKQVNPIAIAFRYYELESYEEALANCEYVLKIGNDKKINSIPYNINDYYNENIDFYEGIIDYRKSRKLIKKLNKAENKPITINMSAEYREEFDIFQTIANIMNLKIKRLFLDKNGFESCEYDNGEILNIENIDLYRYPKLKSLIWWRE
ncbi:DNA methyltransferase [uncultured Brachyspira sp.]|uniref:site-specific DNA-methyltransferase n=1 Tax=uncultured Brachyspira sp. TaxID=221953 RepID=UPI002594CE49|nr:DNA methyltransferase [uncultured Brachyspira sp.]